MCAADCFIAGKLIPAGTVNPVAPCLVCAPASSTTTWSAEPDGTSCGAADVCSAGACIADCFIAGMLYPAGTIDPADACQVCAPAASTTTWSNEPDGTSCGAGEVCSMGACMAVPPDAGPDGSGVDSGASDGGTVDAGGPDAGEADGGEADGGVDGSSVDGGINADGGVVDGGTTDGAMPEAGESDAAGVDASDSGAPLDGGADSSTGLDSGSIEDGAVADADAAPTADAGPEDGATADAGDASVEGATGGENDNGAVEGGGCGCRVAGSTHEGRLAGLPLLGVVLLLARSRRRRGRQPDAR
jgi:MYXO-CTERM domain-containing protein